MLKYWANFPSDLDNFSLSASIMYQNWWIKLKANPNNQKKKKKIKVQEENKYNQITILKFSFHILIWNSTYFPRLALKKESKYNVTVIAVTLERHYEEIARFKHKVWCICNSRSKQILSNYSMKISYNKYFYTYFVISHARIQILPWENYLKEEKNIETPFVLNSTKKILMNKKISLIKIMYNGYMSSKYRNMPCIHPTKMTLQPNHRTKSCK